MAFEFLRTAKPRAGASRRLQGALFAAAVVVAAGLTTPAVAGAFSSSATRLAPVAAPGRTVSIRSPDGRSKVIAHFVGGRHGRVRLAVSGAIGARRLDFSPRPDAEILWAPDSDAFFVTETDGKAGGSRLLRVVGRFNGELVDRDLTTLALSAPGGPAKCAAPQESNVAGVTWQGSSRRLLVAVEVAPHGACDGSGSFAAYEVDPTRMLLRRHYGQLAAKAKFWKALGPELRTASDTCVHEPDLCRVAALHSKGRQAGDAAARSKEPGLPLG